MTEINKKRKTKIEEAKLILNRLGLPKKQSNNRSAWVFLALANIKPEDDWSSVSAPLLPTVDIMHFIREHYGMDYKPNSRETIRRQTLHQFEQARLVDRNRDFPERPTNSKGNNYSLNNPIIEILKKFPNDDWALRIAVFIDNVGNLKEKYAKKREMLMVPVTLPNGKEIRLTPGKHNQLHADIIHEFCPRFIGKNGVVLYLGDTGSSRNEGGKMLILESEKLFELGLPQMNHSKLPDIVVYDKQKNWLFLIEAVTSHGPISPKRWEELECMFKESTVERVYITAFPDKNEFKKNIADVAWETEVWIAENPSHMIHFNGDKFLGPYSKE